MLLTTRNLSYAEFLMGIIQVYSIEDKRKCI